MRDLYIERVTDRRDGTFRAVVKLRIARDVVEVPIEFEAPDVKSAREVPEAVRQLLLQRFGEFHFALQAEGSMGSADETIFD